MDSLLVPGYVRTTLDRLTGFNEVEKKLILAVALARAISEKLEIPTSPVESMAIYYRTTIDGVVSDVISKMVEEVRFDARMTRDLVFKFWELRYNLQHNSKMMTDLVNMLAMVMPEMFPEQVCNVLKKEEALDNKGPFREAFGYLIGEVTRGLDKFMDPESGTIRGV